MIVKFLQIHPFQDGNGRLSRILTNLLVLQSGYVYVPYVSHEKLVEDNKADYYLALRNAQKTFKTDQETIIPWLEFFLEIVLQQSKSAVKLITEERLEKLLSPSQLKVWTYMQDKNEVAPRELSQELGIPGLMEIRVGEIFFFTRHNNLSA